MHIRKATTEDIDALGALLSRSRQVSGTGHEISMGAEGQTYSEVDLRQVIEGEDNAIYLAIDGDDLVIVSRSGDEQARNAHDGNLVTFHRVRNFRSLVY